jgi:hypothetical protein
MPSSAEAFSAPAPACAAGRRQNPTTKVRLATPPPSPLEGRSSFSQGNDSGECLILPRTLTVQAEERLQQQARAHNQTEAGRKSLRERVVVVEHRIARLGPCPFTHRGRKGQA